jgi:hypothetical protein
MNLPRGSVAQFTLGGDSGLALNRLAAGKDKNTVAAQSPSLTVGVAESEPTARRAAGRRSAEETCRLRGERIDDGVEQGLDGELADRGDRICDRP